MDLRFVAAGLAVMSASVAAQPFDRSLLDGLWAESVRGKFGCVAGNLRTRFVLSEDGKTLTFKLDRKWKINTGQVVDEYSATVFKAEQHALFIQYDESPSSMSPDMIEWEMRFIGPGTYRWRSTAWPEGNYNNVIGVRCSP